MTRAPTVALITPTKTIIVWICHLSLQYCHCTTPIPTLHAALHDLMYVSYEFFLPQPTTPLLRIQVFFFFFHLQAALSVCLSYCTALHVLQFSFHLASLHLPIHHHLSSSFQLQNLQFLQQRLPSSLLPSRTAAPSSTSFHTNTYAIHE